MQQYTVTTLTTKEDILKTHCFQEKKFWEHFLEYDFLKNSKKDEFHTQHLSSNILLIKVQKKI